MTNCKEIIAAHVIGKGLIFWIYIALLVVDLKKNLIGKSATEIGIWQEYGMESSQGKNYKFFLNM